MCGFKESIWKIVAALAETFADFLTWLNQVGDYQKSISLLCPQPEIQSNPGLERSIESQNN
jgi:hypothetical protein